MIYDSERDVATSGEIKEAGKRGTDDIDIVNKTWKDRHNGRRWGRAAVYVNSRKEHCKNTEA